MGESTNMKIGSFEINPIEYDEQIEHVKTWTLPVRTLTLKKIRVHFSISASISGSLRKELSGEFIQITTPKGDSLKVKLTHDSYSYPEGVPIHNYALEFEEYNPNTSESGKSGLVMAISKVARIGMEPLIYYRHLMIPYYYEIFQKQVIEDLQSSSCIAAVDLYNSLARTEKAVGLTKEYFTEHKNEIVLRNTSHLKSAESFFKASIDAIDETKPVMVYYAWVNFASFLIRTFIRFKPMIRHHGLKIHTSSIDDINIEIMQEGFFNRLVWTLAILGIPTVFSTHLICEKDGILTITANSNSSFVGKTCIPIWKIAKYDALSYSEALKKSLVEDSGVNYELVRDIGNYLNNYLLIFAANSIARYNAPLWNDILKGEETDLMFHIKRAFGALPDFVEIIYEFLFRDKMQSALH